MRNGHVPRSGATPLAGGLCRSDHAAISSGVATVSGGWAVEQGHGGFAEVAAGRRPSWHASRGGRGRPQAHRAVLAPDTSRVRTTPTPSPPWSRTSGASSSCAPDSRPTAAGPARPPGTRCRPCGPPNATCPPRPRAYRVMVAAWQPTRPANRTTARKTSAADRGWTWPPPLGRDYRCPLRATRRGRADSPTPCTSRRGRTTSTTGSELVVKRGRRTDRPGASRREHTRRRRSR